MISDIVTTEAPQANPQRAALFRALYDWTLANTTLHDEVKLVTQIGELCLLWEHHPEQFPAALRNYIHEILP